MPYDLVNGQRLPLTKRPDGRYAMTLSMARFGGLLVGFFPEPIARLDLAVPTEAKVGQAVHARATIMGTTKPVPGVVTVSFTLEDPKGNVSVVSGVRPTRDGTAAFDWTPASNDPAGTWTIEASELASGKTAKRTFRLAAQ